MCDKLAKAKPKVSDLFKDLNVSPPPQSIIGFKQKQLEMQCNFFL